MLLLHALLLLKKFKVATGSVYEFHRPKNSDHGLASSGDLRPSGVTDQISRQAERRGPLLYVQHASLVGHFDDDLGLPEVSPRAQQVIVPS